MTPVVRRFFPAGAGETARSYALAREEAMKQDERVPFVDALHRARVAAYPPGEYVEQESFMRASEIRAIADRAGIVEGTSVLDLCCGIAGPGRLLTRERACVYLGADYSASAIGLARERASGLPCQFEISLIPPVPSGSFDAVMLLETMLAFPEKALLLREISEVLVPGGRFAFTLEEGLPMTESERALMPDAETVWLTPLPEMLGYLEQVGLRVGWQQDWSEPHRAIAESLRDAFARDGTEIAAQIGAAALEDLLAAHELWSDWLEEGRVRKIALVTEKA